MSTQQNTNLASTTYKWAFHPHLYSDDQLNELTTLLNKNIDISLIENPEYTAGQLKILGEQLEKNRDLTKLVLMKRLPVLSVLNELFKNDQNYNELMQYVTPTTNFKTITWIASWIGTSFEKGLAPLLNYSLDWAQLDSLTSIYKKYIQTNGSYLDPRILVEYNVPFDLMDSIDEIYETSNIDLTPLIKQYDFESLKNIIFAVKNNVPEKYFYLKVLSATNIENIEDLYLKLIRSYTSEEVDLVLVNLIKNNETKIPTTLKALSIIEWTHKNFKFACKHITKGLPKLILVQIASK